MSEYWMRRSSVKAIVCSESLNVSRPGDLLNSDEILQIVGHFSLALEICWLHKEE